MTEYFTTEENQLTHQERTKRYYIYNSIDSLHVHKNCLCYQIVVLLGKTLAGLLDHHEASLDLFCLLLYAFPLLTFSIRFELAYTHTMYYLAQVYKNLGKCVLI